MKKKIDYDFEYKFHSVFEELMESVDALREGLRPEIAAALREDCTITSKIFERLHEEKVFPYSFKISWFYSMFTGNYGAENIVTLSWLFRKIGAMLAQDRDSLAKIVKHPVSLFPNENNSIKKYYRAHYPTYEEEIIIDSLISSPDFFSSEQRTKIAANKKEFAVNIGAYLPPSKLEMAYRAVLKGMYDKETLKNIPELFMVSRLIENKLNGGE